jgi:hypothetical protein
MDDGSRERKIRKIRKIADNIIFDLITPVSMREKQSKVPKFSISTSIRSSRKMASKELNLRLTLAGQHL